MNTVYSDYRFPEELFQEYVKKTPKFRNHYEALLQMMVAFITECGYLETVRIDTFGLGYALVDYFEDVRRLKEYHKCEHINSIKITAYLSYWLVKRHVITPTKNDKGLLYINETFVLSFITSFLETLEKGNLLESKKRGIESFRQTLFYYLKYRLHDARDIEMIITAFFAGRVYESDIDISASLPESDTAIAKSFLIP